MDLCVNFKGGGSFVRIGPVFSSSGENVFLASKNAIFEYSTKTGNLLYKYQGMTDDIAGFGRVTTDNFDTIIACSKTGQLVMWKADATNKIKILETKIKSQGFEIRTFHIVSDGVTDDVRVLVSYAAWDKNHDKCQIRLKLVNIKTGEGKFAHLKLNVQESYKIDVRMNKYFAVVQANSMYLINSNTLTHERCNMAENNRKFTCVSCHPLEEVVLTGDDTGRVVVWQNVFQNRKTQAVYHWHTLPVGCVAFSPHGSYFYSGADECVLVKWNFNNVRDKSFLPRLPAGIRHVAASCNGAFLAVATADNAVRILDSSMNQSALIQHLVLGAQYETGIIYDDVARALVMNGNVGCVQFYSPEDMTLLYNVDIVNQNKITDERDCKMENTDVRKVALSGDHRWMATVEERRESDACRELRLKFWRFNSEKQTYELNTSIEYPHESSVDSIAFQPVVNRPRLVTVGRDKKFKVWQVTELKTAYKSGPIWNCYGVGYYRELDCQCLSFSVDGSLMAVGFDSILTCWTPDSCDLKCSLVHPTYRGRIVSVQFGRGNQCHLVAAAGRRQVAVWNLLTLSMVWVVPLDKISLLVADGLSTHMVVITEDNKVYVFEPGSPKPVFSSRRLLKNKEPVVAAAFVPSKYSNDTRLAWYERSNLYFITSNKELYSVSKNEEILEYNDSSEDTEKSFFGKTLPATKTSSVRPAQAKMHLYEMDTAHKNLHEYLESPLQTLPPIRFLCASLLKSLVLQKETFD